MDSQSHDQIGNLNGNPKLTNFKMRDLFLIVLLVVLIFTAWAGYFRVLGIQTHRLSHKRSSEIILILGRTPAFPKPTLHHFLSGRFQQELEEASQDSLLFFGQAVQFFTHWKSLEVISKKSIN